MAQTVKASICNEETWVQSLGWEDVFKKLNTKEERKKVQAFVETE